jgi:hypothetical protein
VRKRRADIGFRGETEPRPLVGFPLDLIHQFRREFTNVTPPDGRQPFRDQGAQLLQLGVAPLEEAHGGPDDLDRVVVFAALDLLPNPLLEIGGNA